MKANTIPGSPEELLDFLGDEKTVKNLGKEGLVAMLNQASKKIALSDPDIDRQLEMKLQDGMAKFLKESKDSDGTVPLDLSVPKSPYDAHYYNKHGLFNPRALGAKLDKKYGGGGDMLAVGKFFNLISPQRSMTPEGMSARQELQNAFSESIPSQGGFLVPEVLRSELLRVALENSIVRSRARIVPMDSLRVPYPAIDDTSHASSVYGGLVGYWTEEGAALTASQGSFGQTVLEAKKLTMYTEVPSELVSDSVISFTQFLNQIFPEALAWFEDNAFINGTGVGEPQGVLNSPAAVQVTRNTSSHVKFQDVINMYVRMLPMSQDRAVWIAGHNVLPELLSLVMPTGDATTTFVAPPLWLNGQQVINGPAFTLLGRPVIFSEKVPALGSTGDLAFVDFGYYLLGDRQAMSASSSTEFKFQNDLVAYRIIERVDGRTWIQSSIVPKNGGPSLTPVVVLK